MGASRFERRWWFEALSWALAIVACDLLLRASGLPEVRSGTSLCVWLICATGLQRAMVVAARLGALALSPAKARGRKARA